MQMNDTLFTCPVCLDKAKIKFRKPNFIKSTVITHECTMCECDFQITLSKPRGGQKKMLVDVQVQLTHVSDYAIEHHDGDGSMKKIVEELKSGPIYANDNRPSEPMADILTLSKLQAEKEKQKNEAC